MQVSTDTFVVLILAVLFVIGAVSFGNLVAEVSGQERAPQQAQ